ncbi:surfactant B protein [Histomonas meleagridis]|uniref:surfactant B protein n=1 Tax=Histomonas meleagridis TaxID=135588 RepID=UPI003559D66F|nr:surfactant B protein [Histomonas meleagridis]KAH0806181.1 surfactant B protein [Histomonas meleagridis]
MFALFVALTTCTFVVNPIIWRNDDDMDDKTCNVCYEVFEKIKSIFMTTKSQAYMMLALGNACTVYRDDDVQDICKDIINKNVHNVIMALNEGKGKRTLCNKLKYCRSSRNEAELLSEDDDEIEIPEGLENGIACSICKHLVAAVAKVLDNAQVQTKAVEVAQKLCAKFPKIGRNFCNKLVEKYLPQLISWLSEKVSSSIICNKLKLCQSNDNANDDAYLELYLDMDDDDYVTEVELPIGLTNADNCAICKKAVGFVSSAMKNSIVQAVVKAAATAACGLITSGVGAGLCKTIVKLSVGPIMTWLGQKLSQSKICSKLGYCKGNDIELDIEVEEEDDDDEVYYIPIPEGLDNGVACSTCKTLVSSIATIMKVTKVTSKIAIMVVNICEKLPEQQKIICESLFENYLSKLISWVGSGISNANICKKLSLC